MSDVEAAVEAPAPAAEVATPEAPAEGNLLNTAAATAGAESSWLAGIDKEYLASQTVSNAASVNDLAKQVVNLEKVMGKPRVELPSENWNSEQFNEFYQKLGRPDSPDGYAIEGLPEQFNFEEEDKKQILTTLHEQGLSQTQAQGVVKALAEREVRLSESVDARMAENETNARQTLEKEWGDQFEQKLRLSGATLNNLVDPETAEALETAAGNNPAFIKLLAVVGEKLMDDTAFKGDLQSNSWSSPIAAQAEIDQLKMDGEFQKMLTNKSHPGHKAAMERWTRTFSNAYPS